MADIHVHLLEPVTLLIERIVDKNQHGVKVEAVNAEIA